MLFRSADIVRFFAENYGTDRAFVVMNGPLPADLQRKLEAVATRKSQATPRTTIRVMDSERSLKFSGQDETGAVIFAAPVPGVFYRDWFAALMFDRLIQATLAAKVRTTIIPALDPFYWRLEVPVPAGKFAEAVQEDLMQNLNRMQFARATTK